jgi:hypothetical protein
MFYLLVSFEKGPSLARSLSSLFFALFFFFCVCVLVLVCVWCAWLDTYIGYTLESLSNFRNFLIPFEVERELFNL